MKISTQQIVESSADIYHWATKGMMHLVCMQMFNTCYSLYGKPRIRKIFEKLSAKLGQLVNLNRPVFYLAKALLYAVNFQFSAPILLNFSILGSILLQLRVKARSYLLGRF